MLSQAIWLSFIVLFEEHKIALLHELINLAKDNPYLIVIGGDFLYAKISA